MIRTLVASCTDTGLRVKKISSGTRTHKIRRRRHYSQCHSNVVALTLSQYCAEKFQAILSKMRLLRSTRRLHRKDVATDDQRPTRRVASRNFSSSESTMEFSWHARHARLRENEGGKRARERVCRPPPPPPFSRTFFFFIFTERVPRLGAKSKRES